MTFKRGMVRLWIVIAVVVDLYLAFTLVTRGWHSCGCNLGQAAACIGCCACPVVHLATSSVLGVRGISPQEVEYLLFSLGKGRWTPQG
jgi:hypothetical protein